MRNWRTYTISALVLLGLILLPLFTGVYVLQVVDIILMYMVLGLSWDMLLRAGQLSFGMAGFCGLGGYTAALLAAFLKLDPITTILIGGVASGVVAFLVGISVLHLRGMYFAIVTFALAEIFRVIIKNAPDLTGGVEGTILPNAIFDGNSTYTYWLVLAVAVITIVISEIFQKTRIRLASTSIRNDEIVSQSSGINVFKFLLFIFIVTSMIQGLVGGLFAHIYAFVSPESSFSIEFSLLPLTMVLLGGVNSTWGAVLGAFLLGGVAEYLKLHLRYGHLIVYGFIIVLVILFFPQGVLGIFKKRFSRKQ